MDREPLLTVAEVARLLQMSCRTIYANARRLGGFYPAGIRSLRFRREDIYGIMEGPEDRQVPLRISVPGQEVRQGRVCHKKGGEEGRRGAPKVSGTGPDPDPSIAADLIRFGLRDPNPGGTDGKIPAPGRKGSS